MGKTTVCDASTAGGLRTSETEIDILCIGPDHKEYLVGECKYKNSAFTYAEYLDTRAKLAPMKQDAFLCEIRKKLCSVYPCPLFASWFVSCFVCGSLRLCGHPL